MSVTGCNNHLQRQQGLTLIEVLMVIFIVGVIYSMVTLSIKVQDDKRLEDEAKRIIALLTLAREEAIMQNRELALEFEEKTYRFVEWDAEGKTWTAYAEKGMFRSREMPEDIELNIAVQQGMKSFGFDQGRFMIDAERSNESEHAVHHFHGLVLDAYDRAAK